MTSILAWIIRCALWLRYRIEIRGLDRDALPRDGVLVLPNHPGEMDPVIVTSLLWNELKPRPVVVEDFYYMTGLTPLMKWISAIPMPSMVTGRGSYKRWRIRKALEGCGDSLNAGDNILIYPSGRLMQSGKEDLGSASGVGEILEATKKPKVLLVRTRGLIGSSFSWVAHQDRPDLFGNLLKAAGYLILNFGVFTPRRKVTVDLEMAPDDFPFDGTRQELNSWLEAWYNKPGEEELVLPSYLFWMKKQLQPVMPEEERGRSSAEVPEKVRARVLAELSRRSNQDVADIADSANLARELGLDSLETADIAMWVVESFHCQVDLATLHTVADVLHAASAPAQTHEKEAVRTPPKGWLESSRPSLRLPDAEQSIAFNFLMMTESDSGAVAVADELSGVLSRGRLRMAVVLMAEQFRSLPGERVGVMLPAGVGATISTLALQVAGKVPVMINWTVGDVNLQHVIKSSGLQKIITAERFLDVVDTISFEGISDLVVPLESVKKNLSLGNKLRAVLLARKSAQSIADHFGLQKPEPSDHAVVLYTSGSESAPKGVPLTHLNLLSNIQGALGAADLGGEDVLFGYLPPFHSFGFTVTTMMPMVTGLKTAFYANPTESRNLARGVGMWRATLMAGTPTFIGGILRAAHDEELTSLRFLWAGAERAPDELFEEVDRRTKAVVMEGYGITECSPVLTIVRPDEKRVGVGRPVGDVELMIVNVESEAVVPVGEQGLILASGSSIFHGYIGRESDSVFRKIDGKDWYVTGDLGYLAPCGSLVLTGRLKRFVKVGGEMVSLPAMEDAIRKLITDGEDGPRAAVTAVEPEGERPIICLFSVEAIKVDAVNHHLRENGFGNLSRIQRVESIDAIPALGTGKTDYRTLTDKLKAVLASGG